MHGERMRSVVLVSVALAMSLARPAGGQPVPAPQTRDAPASKPTPPAPAPAPTPPAPTDTAQAPDVTASGEPDSGEVVEVTGRAPPGAQTQLGKDQLERDEQDDIHKVLGNIAGVYLRDEDGYGLRPNIGMRGAAADRSSKIALMEDGVLIAPAPYTAPAAYYVPLMTRLSSVVVTKGPSAIRFGPNTVGGAIDLISEPMPGDREAYVDVAGGSNLYGKLHARAAERRKRWAMMAEYVKLRTDGFKNLDTGGPTGFDKDDAQITFRTMSPPTATQYHQLDLRLGYGRELSHETYTGLSDADFALDPLRRYAGTQLDQMDWDHWRMRATHRLELGAKTRVVTVAYRHRFHRAWGKIDGFVGQRDLYGLLANPNTGTNAIYYGILTGQIDSSVPEEQLIFGTNDRTFTSQGIQSTFTAERSHGDFTHHLDVGARIHFDRADRLRYEDTFDMIGGTLVRSMRPQALVLDSRAETTAFSTFVEDSVHWKRLKVTAGARVELIDFRFADRLSMDPADANRGNSYGVVIPGGGAEFKITDQASVLAGVHRGFVPVAPSATAEVRPESSVNYEAGGRWRSEWVHADLIGFFSNYQNLKGSCSLASGCMDIQDGQEFNGGRVHVYGTEAQVGGEVVLAKKQRLTLPIIGAYTFTRSAFQSTFSSDFAGWGDVQKGDELPYLPRHQVSLAATLKTPRWEFGAAARYRGETRDVAGLGMTEEYERISDLFTIDLTGHVRMRDYAELYATCTNLLDEQVIISRRPYGPRPNAPRLFALGYKGRF
jgi:Fe(3+) dicitrate transport protein